jgi:AcrR family transcriptional regulator
VNTRARAAAHPRGEDTRRRILDVAIAAFAADGYEGVGTRALADRAGVTLPAIQYYFGSKEGLYRAAIEHISGQIQSRMEPVAERVRAALAKRDVPRSKLIELLQSVLHDFVAMVAGGDDPESRRLLFARAEIERGTPLVQLQECGKREVFEPCVELVARLLDKPATDEQVVLRTLMLLGQAVIFCNKGARRALDPPDYTEARISAIQALLREHIAAIFRATKAART